MALLGGGIRLLLLLLRLRLLLEGGAILDLELIMLDKCDAKCGVDVGVETELMEVTLPPLLPW